MQRLDGMYIKHKNSMYAVYEATPESPTAMLDDLINVGFAELRIGNLVYSVELAVVAYRGKNQRYAIARLVGIQHELPLLEFR